MRSISAIISAILGAAFVASSVMPSPAADAEHGKALYAACAACHQDKPDALGPNLRGVFGRKSAALDDFRYSNPMKRANLVWDEANLREYIADPQAKVRGNRMPFDGLHDPKDVDDIVEYIKTYK